MTRATGSTDAADRPASATPGTGGAAVRRTRAERGPGTAATRLRRILAVVPYVIQHPGVRLRDLSALFDLHENDLAQDLNLLFLAGVPPYGPGDLIDVEIDEDGGVWIGMAEYFARPLRLTRAEAMALYLRGKALVGSTGVEESAAIGSALAKIERELGPDTLGALAGRVAVGGAPRHEAALQVLRSAIHDRETVRIEYYAAGRDELSSREIDPEQLFTAIGNWYVVAWDHHSGEERTFRADRIRSVTATGARFEPRGLAGAGRPLYSPTDRDVRVRLVLAPAARWAAEYYITESTRERSDGRIEVVFPARDLEWVVKLVLRLGGEAEVLEPEDLLRRVRDAAERTLQLYRRGPKRA
jgi:proteasome accessory factor C